jgi:hypothetical protein
MVEALEVDMAGAVQGFKVATGKVGARARQSSVSSR